MNESGVGFAALEDLRRLDLRVGTIRSAEPNRKARHPAYVLQVDFGTLGVRRSSAQLTRNYAPEELVGRQVICVLRFPPKRVAGVDSEVLVLAAVSPERGVILLGPDQRVEDGTPVA